MRILVDASCIQLALAIVRHSRRKPIIVFRRGDGLEVSNEAWLTARAQLQSQVKKEVAEMAARYSSVAGAKAASQREATRLRLIDELGRLLICYEPDTDDWNGKFYRLASEQTPTGHRLQTVFGRLGSTYPEWEGHFIADLREFRAELGPSQVKSRLTGGPLDAALADPRWAMDTSDDNRPAIMVDRACDFRGAAPVREPLRHRRMRDGGGVRLVFADRKPAARTEQEHNRAPQRMRMLKRMPNQGNRKTR
ncbi:MAG: hypothetical protein AB7F35_20165 [Acetobacteraceae bacterium]